MRIACFLTTAFFALLVAVDPAAAQVPVATGRQFTLSNAAWKVFIPSTYQARLGDVADLLVHFHGDPQTYWNNAAYAELNTIIVTVNYSGLSSAYSTPFSNTSLFQQVVSEALTKVRAQADIPDTLQWDKMGVSSFSAGYGAVREILKSTTYRNDIDALVAADSLYATTAVDGTPLDSQMVDYKTYANLAKSGSKTFIYSHSQVPTYTYETTGECGDELMQFLGISPTPVNLTGLGNLNFYRHAKSGNFELWGATGSDAAAHSKHLQNIGEFLEELPLNKLHGPGDFNADGTVDAADYVVWRDSFGSTTNLAANGDNTGASLYKIDAADLAVWKKNFGVTGAGNQAVTFSSVPEPATWLSAVAVGLAVCLSRWRKPLHDAAPD